MIEIKLSGHLMSKYENTVFSYEKKGPSICDVSVKPISTSGASSDLVPVPYTNQSFNSNIRLEVSRNYVEFKLRFDSHVYIICLSQVHIKITKLI